MEKEKILMTESTKELVEKEIENFEELDEIELVAKINATKKMRAVFKESGEIEVKQVLNG